MQNIYPALFLSDQHSRFSVYALKGNEKKHIQVRGYRLRALINEI